MLRFKYFLAYLQEALSHHTELIQTRGKHNLGLGGSPLKSNKSNIYTIEIYNLNNINLIFI